MDARTRFWKSVPVVFHAPASPSSGESSDATTGGGFGVPSTGSATTKRRTSRVPPRETVSSFVPGCTGTICTKAPVR